MFYLIVNFIDSTLYKLKIMNNQRKKTWGRKLLGVVFLLFSFHLLYAQDSYILYGFTDVPQSISLNPAFRPDASLFIGIPALSNVEVSLLNTEGSYSDFFKYDPAKNVDVLDMTHVIKSGNEVGFSRFQVNEDLLFAGFKIKKTFLSFGVSQRLSFNIIANNDLLKLIWYSDAQNAGTVLHLDNTTLSESHMLDYHIGLSVPVTSNFNLGARIHLLQGLSNIQTKNSGLSFTSTSNGNGGYDMYTTAYLLVNTSGFNQNGNNNFSASQYLSDFNNMGFAVDLGASVKVNDQFNIAASVLDLGSVSYHSNNQNFQTNANNIDLTASLSDIFKSNDALSNLGDTLKSLFHATQFSQSYSVPLPTRIFLSAAYNFKQHGGRISILFADKIYKGYNNMAGSVAYDYGLGKHFNFKVNYTYIKGDPVNVGAALAFQFKPIQFYVYTDNVLTVSWKSSKYAHAGFGLNILIPNRNVEKMIKSASDQPDAIEP